MSAPIRLDRKRARRILLRLERCQYGDGQSMADEEWLRSLLAPSTKATRARTAARAQKTSARERKNAETAAIYVRVAQRAGGLCECGCGRQFLRDHPVLHPELDHAEGRGKARQSVANCWLLAKTCHQARHAGRPSRAEWLIRWAEHCERHHYFTEARKARDELASDALVAEAAGVSGVAR